QPLRPRPTMRGVCGGCNGWPCDPGLRPVRVMRPACDPDFVPIFPERVARVGRVANFRTQCCRPVHRQWSYHPAVRSFAGRVLRALANQPVPDACGDGPEPTIVDTFPVVATHRGVSMAHYQVDGYWVAGGIGDGAEDVPEGVEADAFVVDA